MKGMNIGIVGFGFVGRAVCYGFELHTKVYAYDKYGDSPDTLEESVRNSDFIFVCVPTPMDDGGNQDLSYMDDAIENIVDCERRDTNKSDKIIVIKSTVLPGTTRLYAEKYPNFDFVFNPEFLTQRVAKLDFINQSRIILGGNLDATRRARELYEFRFGNSTPIFECSWEEAELVKYISNCFFAVKISFCNEIYELVERMGLQYNTVKDMWLADWRIARSHTEVPGHDGLCGFGGACFPKDIKALENFGNDLGLDMDIFKAAVKVNNRVRPDKDWEKIPGATTKKGYNKGD